MALNPNYLDSLPNTLVDMYSLVEIDILEDMARRISTYDFFIPSALHQNQKLQELGMVQEDIIKALSAMTGQTQQEIVALLTEAGEVAIEDDVEYYKAADVYKPEEINTEALHKQLNSGLLQTQQAFKNITRTTPNSGGIQFINALDRAWTQINVGGMDYNTAIHNAIKDLAKQGLAVNIYRDGKIETIENAIKYNRGGERGRVDTLEVAVRRAVVTGANQTAAKTQEVLADELGVDLVEVTAHGGARPEHAEWQGKVYSRHGRKVIDGVVYEDFETATRYGHGDGLGGWNCRHNFHPYVHGAPRTWTDEEIKALDKKDIEYNGKKYTEYEASQIQRGIERDIRSLKRQVAAIEAGGGDASAERAKLRKAQKGYTDFTEQTGLKKQTARTKIGTPEAQKVVDKAQKAANVKLPTTSDILTQRKEKQVAQQEGGKVSMPKEFINNYDDFEELRIEPATAKTLQELHKLSRDSGNEYGVIMKDGKKVGKPFTSNKNGRLEFSLDDYEGGNLEIYHSHTNVTPLSAKDFSFLLNKKVAKIGNIAYNNDVFIASVGNGWIPTVEEFNDVVKNISDEIDEQFIFSDDYASYTPEERVYMAIREQSFRIARHFKWTMEGGNIND